jgi:anti-sigma B factor antagonist
VNTIQIDDHKSGDVCVVDIVGELRFGKSIGLLQLRTQELIDAGEKFFVLNMTQSPWLDSSGIGAVVEFFQRARTKRGVVKLVLTEKSRSIFTLSQLEKMFDIFDDLDSAVASFDEPDGRYRERL